MVPPRGMIPAVRREIEHLVVRRWQQPFKAIVKADHLPSAIARRAHHAAQDGVESGAITAAGQDADTLHGLRDARSENWEDRAGVPPRPTRSGFSVSSPSAAALPPPTLRNPASHAAINCWPRQNGRPAFSTIMFRRRGVMITFSPSCRLSGGRAALMITHSPALRVVPVFTPSMPFTPSSSLVLRSRYWEASPVAVCEADFALLLAHVKTKRRTVHRVGGQLRKILRGAEGVVAFQTVEPVRIEETRARHAESAGERIHLRDEGCDGIGVAAERRANVRRRALRPRRCPIASAQRRGDRAARLGLRV